MILSSFTIENFKGISDPLSIEFKPITLLFGPNSAGKSTIVQALHYAREIFERRNLNPDFTIVGGKSVNLGGFKTLVHDHSTNLPLRFRFDLDLEDIDLADFVIGLIKPKGQENIEDWENQIYDVLRQVDSAWIKITIKYDEYDDTISVSHYEVGVNGKLLAMISESDDSRMQVRLTFYPPDFLPDEIASYYHQKMNEFPIDQFESENFKHFGEDYKGTGSEYEAELYDRLQDDLGPDSERKYNKESGRFYQTLGLNFDLGIESVLPEWDNLLDIVDFEYDDSPKEIHDMQKLISSLVLGPALVLIEELKKLKYLGPLRHIPARNHTPALSPDASLWADGTAAWDLLYNASPKLIGEINDWLVNEDRLSCGYEVVQKKYKELDTSESLWISLIQRDRLDRENITEELLNLPEKVRIHFREFVSDIEVMPQDIGIGISQVLPIIVMALEFKSGIVAIEQPELHIHPALQVAIGDLFISQIQKKEVCFLIETHSEHLMLRFLKRIRETSEGELPPRKWPLSPDQLSVFYIEQNEKGTSLYKIRIDEDGEFIDRWPKGFFSERMGELF